MLRVVQRPQSSFDTPKLTGSNSEEHDSESPDFLIFANDIFSQDTLARKDQDTLTRKDFLTGQKFLDLNFTEAEIDSMYFSVRNSVRDIKRMHGYHLSNDVPMTLAHSPILPGMKFNKVQKPVQWNLPAGINVPKNKNELAFYSILQLASLIKNKKITFFIFYYSNRFGAGVRLGHFCKVALLAKTWRPPVKY